MVPDKGYPKLLFHKTEPPVTVNTSEQHAQKAQEGWSSETYIHQEWPCRYYHPQGSRMVNSAAELKALGPGWQKTPYPEEPEPESWEQVADPEVALRKQTGQFDAAYSAMRAVNENQKTTIEELKQRIEALALENQNLQSANSTGEGA